MDGIPTSSFKTNKILSDTRTYNMKNLAGKLASQDRLKLMFPEVYPNANCRLCHQHVEDNNHIWTCGSQYAIARRLEILTLRWLETHSIIPDLPS
jgi:hypothetical protein